METEDIITMGSILVFLIFTLALGLKIIFRPGIQKPKGMRKTDIRRLGFRESEACDLYNYKNMLMLTELKINSDVEFPHDQVEEAFVKVAQEHTILRCSIQTHVKDEGKMYFVPMEDECYDIHCVRSRGWNEEVDKALRKKHDARHGPLWSLVYNCKKNPGTGYQYGFAILYHPAILDQFSSTRVLQLAVDNLRNPKPSSEIQHSTPLFPSLDYLIKTRDLPERLRFGVFFLRCVYYSMMFTSSLRTRVVNRLRNTFVQLPMNERQLYRDSDKNTRIERLVINTGSKTAISETVKKYEVDARSLLLAAVKIAVASLRAAADDDDDDEAVTVRSACVQNSRSLPGIELGEDDLGSYQFDHPVTVKVPGLNLKGKTGDKLKKVALSCWSQTRDASTRRSCLTQIWDQHLVSKVIRPRVNWDKVLESSKGRLPTDVVFDFCDVSSDDVSGDDISSDVIWRSTSLGLGRQGPLLYVSAAVIGQDVCLSLTYSSAVLKDTEVTRVRDLIKETLLDTLV